MKIFDEYNHSVPIIQSHLEGQYKYELSSDEHPFTILFTNFDYHYITGRKPRSEKVFIQVLRDYIEKHKKEEFILYSPSTYWDDYLTKTFTYIGGVIDMRLSFKLDEESFRKHVKDYVFKHDVQLDKVTDDKSNKPYYQAEIYDGDKKVSYCRAFMVGGGQAELDVWTDKKYRYQGLAYEASLVLITILLEEGLTPNWSCWEAKKASRMLAYKLGFEDPKKVKAFIWVSDFGAF